MAYTRDQVFEASLKYFDGDEFAAEVFTSKYSMQDKEGNYLELTPDDMHRRLAREFARIEAKYDNPMSEEEIYQLIKGFKYIVPQGSPMSAIGNNHHIQSISNCFVVQGVHTEKLDSYGGIMLADQEIAHIFRRRGGCGIDISGIRPKGMPTNNSAKTTDGIGIFMERFSNTTREVAQNARRGALMQTISVKHPEIETFIKIKQDKTKVTGANISIKLTDDFMEAVKNNQDYTLRFPVTASENNAKITKIVDSKKIWDDICYSAWFCAEPGILFIDNIHKTTPSDIYKDEGFETVSTNPCGEIPLSIADACRLISINLSSYVQNPFTTNAYFDFNMFNDHTIKCQRLMDDVIDLELEKIDVILNKIENDPEPKEVKQIELDLWKKVKTANMNGRRTGLGITALGDCLAMLGIKYGSRESIDMTGKIYRALAVGAHSSSCVMAKERGAFPVFSYEKEKDHEYLNSIFSDCSDEVRKLWRKFGRRNIALTTTAPTGTVSTLTQTSAGIEPVFMLQYKRKKKIDSSNPNAKVDFTDAVGDKWEEFIIYHHGLKKWMDITGETDITKSPYYGATANDIDWIASIELQAIAQKSIDHSISKTCNLPKDISKELISEIYMKAWELGCKGVTVYREGSRDGVLTSIDDMPQSINGRPIQIVYNMSPKRPDELPCDIKKVKIAGEAWTVFVSLLDGKPYEIFGGLSKYIDISNKYKTGKILKNGKVNGVTTYNLALGDGDDQIIIKNIVDIFENRTHGAFTRVLSLNLRHGTPLQYMVEQLQKDKHSDMTSFSKVIARVLKTYIKDGTKATIEKSCSECGSQGTLIYQEGCLSCVSCKWSKCS